MLLTVCLDQTNVQGVTTSSKRAANEVRHTDRQTVQTGSPYRQAHKHRLRSRALLAAYATLADN